MSTAKRKPSSVRGELIEPTAAVRIARLPTFKLDHLNTVSARHGELFYKRLFGLRAIECRVLGVVAHHGPVTLKRASIELGIDKGQGSRLVAQMLAGGLLERHDDPTDQRSFFLVLSPAGRRLHERVAAAAAARNERWMQGLPEGRRTLFVECLESLTSHAQQMLREESGHSGSSPAALPQGQHGEAAAAERAMIVQPEALRELQRQLAALLGEAAALPARSPRR